RNLLRSCAAALFPTRRSSDLFPGAGLLIIEGGSDIVIRGVTLQGARVASNGIWITAGRNISIAQGSISGVLYNGVHLTSSPSSEDRKSTRLNSRHSQISYAVY